MSDKQRLVLVVGATGFLGRRVVAALRAQGVHVRCMARTPEKAKDLISDGVGVVPGDMLDAAAVEQAADGVSAVIVCVHTLSPQSSMTKKLGFMDIEAQGLQHVVDSCKKAGVTRVLYVTSIGVARDSVNSWLRGRWETEQALLTSGLDATVVRPGMIVGRGGDGFGVIARAATKGFTVAMAGPRQRFRTIAVDDLALDLVELMDSPEAIGKVFEVGSDDVLTMKEMVKIAAASVSRKPGTVLFIPSGVLRLLAPVVERVAKMPRGAMSGFAGEGAHSDMVGDPKPLRTVLGRSDRPFAQAIEGELS